MAQGKNLSKDTDAITLTLPLKLPSLNDYVELCRRNRYQSAARKKDIEKEIAWYLKKMRKLKTPITIDFIWVEKHRKRDLDNIAFSKKFILDAMVKEGILTNDSGKYVVGFTDTLEYGKGTKVKMVIHEEVKNEAGR